MKKVQALDGGLASMKELHHTVNSGISNDDVQLVANTLPVRMPSRVKNDRLIDNVLLARSIFKPNPYYGTRLGANQHILIDVGELGAQDLDFFITDSSGIPKNRASDNDILQRIALANEQGKKVVTFFGGSTTMGTGARLPAFAIPSLVEQILRFKYQIDTVCVNRGIIGMTSQDSFNMLTPDELGSPPDYVVFYTGWNCAFNFTSLQAILNSKNHSLKNNVYLGMSTRHIEHNIHLSQQFSSSSAMKRAFWLLMNNLLTLISKISSSKSIRKFLNKMLKFDPTVNHSFVAEIIDEISSADTNVVALAAAKDYLRVIRLAHACCKSEQTTFINFFQPCLSWGDKPMTPTEQEYLKNSPPMGGVQRKFQEFVMSKPQPDYFHDLSDIFDTVQQQVFIDTGHLNPDGNLIVAERMADQLAIQLK